MAMNNFRNKFGVQFIFAAFVGIGLSVQSVADTAGDSDLAQELTNPIANLITIPIQMSFDNDIGANDQGSKITTNFQPVIPFEVNNDWSLITRTIMPVIDQDEVFPGQGSQFGLGDINMSLFFSPKKPAAGGVIWGVGPVFVFPTATDSLLGSKKWSAGAGGVALTMRGPWTFGGLANHVWSLAGDSDRSDVSNTFLQPFGAYTWPSAWTVSVQSESNYNWKTEQWSIPVTAAVAKLVSLASYQLAYRRALAIGWNRPIPAPKAFAIVCRRTSCCRNSAYQ